MPERAAAIAKSAGGMENFSHAPIADSSLLAAPLVQWGVAAGIAAAVFVILYFLRSVAAKKLKALATKLHAPWAAPLFDALQETRGFVLIVIALYAGSRVLVLSETADKALSALVFTVVLLQLGAWLGRLIDGWSNRYRDRQRSTNPGAATTIGAIQLILTIFIWTGITLAILNHLGFNITTLVAGLGISGIAVALALQGILGDLFASLFIVLDKTFSVGDFLNVDQFMGTVEYIGWKTTRLRSLSGEQIVFSNANLLASRIRNYGRMYERRVENKFKVAADLPRDKLKAIPGYIKAAIEAQPKTRFDRAHFRNYLSPQPEFEYVYYVSSPDFHVSLDIQQDINYRLHEAFQSAGISLV